MNGPETAARRRLEKLSKSKSAADDGWGPPFIPAQQAAFRLLTLLYPLPPQPRYSETELADPLFRDSLVADDDTVSSRKAPQRPALMCPQPDPDEDFVEFVSVPRYCWVNPNYPQEGERLIWSWWQPRSPRH